MRNSLRCLAALVGVLYGAEAVGQVGAPAWSRAYGGVSFEDAPDAVALPGGDFVLAGTTSSPGPSAGFDGSLTQEPPVATDPGNDLLVARFDAAGTLLWERRLGGVSVPVEGNFPPPSYDAAAAIALDGDGNLVVAATSNSAPDATNPAAKQAALIGDSDLWVVKFDPAGATLWERTYGAAGYEFANGIVALPNGNYVVTGTQQPDPQRPLDQSATEDLYVVVIGPDGALLRERTYGGAHYDRTWSTLGLSDGSVIVGGASASEANPGMGKTRGRYGNADIFLVHLDPEGEYLRDYQFGSPYTEQPFALAEDAFGNVFVAAESKYTGDNVSPGPETPTRDLAAYGPLGPPAEPDVYYLAFAPGPAATVLYEGVYGGSAFDRARAALALPNGCILFAGDTRSSDRARADGASAPAGQSDAWLVQLGADGSVVADASRGGDANENLSELLRGAEGAPLLIGATGSGPFAWNADGAYVGPIPEANGIFLAQLTCSFAVDLGPDRPLCSGAEVTLSNLAESPSEACRSWTWIDDAGTVLAATPTYTFTPDRDVTVTLTSVGPDGCERSDDVAFAVADVRELSVATTDPVCDEPGGRIVASATGAAGIRLTAPASAIDRTEMGDDVVFDDLTAGTYTVATVGGSDACLTDTTVTLSPASVADDFAFDVRERELCLGGAISFVTAFDGLASYRILGPDGVEVICDDADPDGCDGVTYAPDSVGAFTFTLDGETAEGCPVPADVTAIVADTASITLASRLDPACRELGALEGTFSGGAISLNGGDAQSGGAFSYADLGPGTYILRVGDAGAACAAEVAVTLRETAGLDVAPLDDLEACIGEGLVQAAPAGLRDPAVASFAWFDVGAQAEICDCSVLPLPTEVPSTRAIALRATTTDGCTYADTFAVDVYAAPSLSVVAVDESCGGASDGSLAVVTDASRLLVDGVEYPAGGGVGGLPPGRYEVVAESPLPRCRSSVEADVAAGETFAVDLGRDTTVLAGIPVTIGFDLDDPSAYDIAWRGLPDSACADCTTQTFAFAGDAVVGVSVVGPGGCEFSDEIAISTREDRRVYVPTAFSPNGDGRHDRFGPYLSAFVERAGPLRIFDRWGNAVFVQADLPRAPDDLSWDGTYEGEDAAVGVYTYVLSVAYINGETRVFRGDVTLLR